MKNINSDTLIAIFLLLGCGVLFWSSFEIREPDYGVLMPSTWPRIIIGLIGILSIIYLIQSLRGPTGNSNDKATKSFVEFLIFWRNPAICFVMFFLFLLTLPILGMLIGGVTFVFLLMSLLGGWQKEKIVLHASVALLSVGSMWSIFTFGLGVMLPEGIIFNPFAL